MYFYLIQTVLRLTCTSSDPVLSLILPLPLEKLDKNNQFFGSLLDKKTISLKFLDNFTILDSICLLNEIKQPSKHF